MRENEKNKSGPLTRKEYYGGCITDDNGNVDFSTTENLYQIETKDFKFIEISRKSI